MPGRQSGPCRYDSPGSTDRSAHAAGRPASRQPLLERREEFLDLSERQLAPPREARIVPAPRTRDRLPPAGRAGRLPSRCRFSFLRSLDQRRRNDQRPLRRVPLGARPLTEGLPAEGSGRSHPRDCTCAQPFGRCQVTCPVRQPGDQPTNSRPVWPSVVEPVSQVPPSMPTPAQHAATRTSADHWHRSR